MTDWIKASAEEIAFSFVDRLPLPTQVSAISEIIQRHATPPLTAIHETVVTWQRWAEADGYDNPEFDPFLDALARLEELDGDGVQPDATVDTP